MNEKRYKTTWPTNAEIQYLRFKVNGGDYRRPPHVVTRLQRSCLAKGLLRREQKVFFSTLVVTSAGREEVREKGYESGGAS